MKPLLSPRSSFLISLLAQFKLFSKVLTIARLLHPDSFLLARKECGYVTMTKGFYTQILFLLTGGARFEFVCIAFSGDGKKLASLSGLPDFKLVLWYRNYIWFT